MPLRSHVFMDSTHYRSAANIHYGFSIGDRPGTSTYGYGNSAGAEYLYTSTYTEPDFGSLAPDAAWQERMRQIYLEQSGVRWYTDSIIRRYMIIASLIQSSLTSVQRQPQCRHRQWCSNVASQYAGVHPAHARPARFVSFWLR